MKTRGQGYVDVANRERLPGFHLVHPIKPKALYQRADTLGNNDRLCCGDFPQGSPIQMIEVRMGD